VKKLSFIDCAKSCAATSRARSGITFLAILKWIAETRGFSRPADRWDQAIVERLKLLKHGHQTACSLAGFRDKRL
jgi:hypothetical protein